MDFSTPRASYLVYVVMITLLDKLSATALCLRLDLTANQPGEPAPNESANNSGNYPIIVHL